jgi:uncharacterized protein (TIGR03067 family)
MTRFTLTLGALLGGGLLSVALAQPPGYREPPSRYREDERRERERDEERQTQRELDRLQGTWTFQGREEDGRMRWNKDPDNRFIFEGKRWSRVVGGRTVQAGDLRIADVGRRYTYVDFWQTGREDEGPHYRGILRVDGDTMDYCYSLSGERPTSMETSEGDGYKHEVWRRVRR